jgi:hypothetical protein
MSATLRSRALALAAVAGVFCAGSVSAQESVWQKLTGIFGMSQSPIQLRSGSSEPVAGEIWLVPAAGGAQTRLTAEGGYSSPVFLPDGKALLALRDDVLVRIEITGGAASELARVPGVTRLVGVARERPNDLAVLAVGDGRPRIEIFERSSGRRRAMRHDPQNSRDRLMLVYAEGDEREYGSVRIYIDEQSTSFRQWTDVFIQTAGRPPVDLTNGNGISSRQPALSHDGALVAYVNVGRAR